MRPKGFSLIEFLIGLAVIAIAVANLLPVIGLQICGFTC
jgi:prepilin-type N-terminal cleavage/methylation domain-containing protein